MDEIAITQARAALNDLVKQRHWTGLRHMCLGLDPAILADLLQGLESSDQALIFRLLPRDVATQTFDFFETDCQAHLLKSLGQTQVALLLNEMSPDDRTALLEELPGPVLKPLMELLSPAERQVAQMLLGYPEHSVGRVMTPDYIDVRPDWTVQAVLDYIRINGRDKESLDVIYITDQAGKLIDDLRIKELLTAPLDTRITNLINQSFVSLTTSMNQTDAVSVFAKTDRSALPVIDTDGFLVGMVTVDDVLDIVEEADTADIQKLGGSEVLDDTYMNTSVWELTKKRGRWLVVLFFGEMLTATAMGFFEDDIAKAVVLALFIPLIISSGGNSGSQAATIIVRAMALGEVKPKDWLRVFARECGTGLGLGLLLGGIGCLRILLFASLFHTYGQHAWLIGITVGLALVGVVMWGTIWGAMLPFVMRWLRIDPATSSAPFVATVVDVTGLLLYFSIAKLILNGGLL